MIKSMPSFLASSAGWENDEEVFKWLQKAAALSGDKKAWQSILEDEKRLFAAFS